ncbi:RNA polymerase sigma factor [Paenibacillus thiaminolyticus]|nr:sigma factor [Paenibacillus thiaminolyticus]
MNAEQEWVNRLRGGDREALRSLMDAYGNDVMRTAVLLLGDQHGAEDISQEVFWIVFRRIHQKSENGRLRAWIMKITVNLCRAQMRKPVMEAAILQGAAVAGRNLLHRNHGFGGAASYIAGVHPEAVLCRAGDHRASLFSRLAHCRH